MTQRPLTRAHAQLNIELQRCLGALLGGECDEAEFAEAVRGNCSENEFVDAIAIQLRAEPESKPKVMALINRLQSRGEVSLDLVRFLESKIAADQLPQASDDITVDLKGAVTSSCVALDRPPAAPVGVGRVLRKRYVIEKRLGSGGKGTVFKALDSYRSGLPSTQRHVAIKVLHGVVDGRAAMVESLKRELYCAQMLSHRNIVNVFELDRDGDVDFFTMELLEGELLSTVMARFEARPMYRPHAWAIIRQIASGLAHAHSRDVVHADLKPQNIMITDSGEVRILDFGASRVASKRAPAAREQSAQLSATLAYASCEILSERAADWRDDLYAFACISYELLTGRHPFQRRRATDARDLGIVATRPSGLSQRQWRTFVKGLSWHRAGRSIPVSDWFQRLNADGEEAQALPSPRDLGHAIGPAASPFRVPALLTLLAVTAVAWILSVRLAPGGKVGGETAAAATASVAPEGALANATSEAPSIRDQLLRTASALPPVGPSQALSKVNSDGSRARFPSDINHPIAVAASDYEVRPGQHYAEIRVRRPSGQRGDAGFVWWTEAASAKPGVDYVQQGKVAHAFPMGKGSTSFFVKLIPKTSRTRPEVFYVAIGEAAGGPSLGQIVHTAVWLPASEGPLRALDAGRSPQTATVAQTVSPE
jgi:serine/threonine protein kinase